MSAAPESVRVVGRVSWLVAAGIAALTYFSPVSLEDADGAIGLLAAQALLEHGALRLEVYEDRPELVYDLSSDYRLVEREGSIYYHSFGYPLLTAPAVWIANRCGLDMLDPQDERRLQNLLSAASCGLVFALLVGICQVVAAGGPALVIATVTTLGSSLVSTLGTALWSANLALVLLCCALRILAPRMLAPAPGANGSGGRPRFAGREWLAMALLPLAVLTRPSLGLFIVALVLALFVDRWQTALAALAVSAFVLGVWWGLERAPFGDWLPAYYSLDRLKPREPLAVGLPGLLWSPSRGVLVFSPFLVPLLLASVTLFGKVWRQPLGRLALLWPAVLVLALSQKGMWWGGQAYGPRLLAEGMPAFAMLAALVWHQLRGETTVARATAACLYLTLAIPAVWIHSVQGLFNPEVLRWGHHPDTDRNLELLFDWRYPQFLASDRQIAEREIMLGRPQLRPYEIGRRIDFASDRALYAGWYQPESRWRWSHGRRADVILLLRDPASLDELHVLEIVAGAHGRQTVQMLLDGVQLGEIQLQGFEPQRRLVEIPGSLLRAGERRLSFVVSDPATAEGDSRRLGLALRSLWIFPVGADSGHVGHDDDTWFVSGFADAERGWRWTVQRRALVVVPLAGSANGRDFVLRLTAGSVAEQKVHLRLNDEDLGTLSFGRFEPSAESVPVPRQMLRSPGLNRLSLEVPGASATAADPRLLGIAVVRLTLSPLEAGGREG